MPEEKRHLMRLEIARTGIFGATGTPITKRDLQDVVETFDGKAPISLGHYMARQDWWPSWGNVENIYLKEDANGTDATLVADISVLDPLYEAIKDGFYPGWSVSIPERAADGKRYLHHLAFLGATPPKIRDLKSVIPLTDVPPENSIKVGGEGFAYADCLEFSSHDFADFAVSELDEDGNEVKLGQEGKGSEGTGGSAFSDTDSPIVKKAKAVYSRSIKDRLDAALKDKIPVGKMALVHSFADEALKDFDFADDALEQPAIVKLFLDIVEAMDAKRAAPEPGRMNFSDIAGGTPDDSKIDRNALAAKF